MGAAFEPFPVFQRAGVLVDVVQSATTEQDRGRVVSVEGIARIRELPLPRVHELLTRAAQFEKSRLLFVSGAPGKTNLELPWSPAQPDSTPDRLSL